MTDTEQKNPTEAQPSRQRSQSMTPAMIRSGWCTFFEGKNSHPIPATNPSKTSRSRSKSTGQTTPVERTKPLDFTLGFRRR